MSDQEREALEEIEKMTSAIGGLSWSKAIGRLIAVRKRAQVALAAREDTERPDTHKLKLTIEDGSVYEELIHPNHQEDCDPPTTCSKCHRSYADEEIERCYDCPTEGETVQNCWLEGHEDLAECLVEKVEIVVDVVAHWDGERPVLHLRDTK